MLTFFFIEISEVVLLKWCLRKFLHVPYANWELRLV